MSPEAQKIKAEQDRLAKSVNGLQLEKEGYEKEITEVKGKLAVIIENKGLIEAEIATLSKEVSGIKEAIASKKLEEGGLNRSISNLTTELAATKEKLESAQSSHSSLMEKNKNEYENAAKSYNSKIDILKNEIALLESNIEDLKSQKKVAEDINGRIAEDIAAKENKLDGLTLDIESKAKTIEAQAAALDRLFTQISIQNTRIDDKDKEISGKTEVLKSLATDIANAEAVLKQVQDEFEKEKGRLFAISDREAHVKQQEAFVKDRFAQAGITYTEFTS